MTSDLILHICHRGAWKRALAEGVYKPDSLVREGFIHLSYAYQVVRVANFLYRGQQDLVLLCIDPDQVDAEIKVEALGTGEPFPHLYESLNLDAVVRVLEFPSNQDGTFTLLDKLKQIA